MPIVRVDEQTRNHLRQLKTLLQLKSLDEAIKVLFHLAKGKEIVALLKAVDTNDGTE